MLSSVTAIYPENLPGGEYPAKIEESPQRQNLEESVRTECILIIEDNPGHVFIMEEALRENNVDCETTVLSDGEQASSYFDSLDRNQRVACPCLVLLDLNLPKRSGHWILNRIRESRRCSSVPVVVVSSSEAPADLEHNRRLGANAYFKKPSNLEEFMKLGALVSSLLRR